MSNTTQIQQLGSEVLRLSAQLVDDFRCLKFNQLVEEMRMVMRESDGVGIAAPQLGYSQQILIIASRPTPRYPHAPEMAPLVMVNPSFEIVDAEIYKDWEGCLSVPGIRALVPRYREVLVAYQTQRGEAASIQLRDFPARVFQHEFDHLLGLVYLDRVESNRDIVAESEFFKRIAA